MANQRYDPNDPSTWNLPPSEFPGVANAQLTSSAPATSAASAGSSPDFASPQTANPNLLGPNFSGPAPASFGGPAAPGQTPVPSVNPQVVYTDASGKGYDPAQLNAAWSDPSFRNDAVNARVGDLLTQYGYGGAPAAPAPATAAASTGNGAVATGAPAAAPQSGWNDAIRQIIMQQIGQATSPVDPNSPEIAATMGAASDAGQRAAQDERTALAERLYAQGGGGLNSNALTQQIQQSGEKQASTLSNLKASLLTNEYNQKRQQLQSLLSLAVQSGDAESARQAQMAIANLNAAVQREGLGVNLSEFGAQLNQNAALAGLNG